ncbi:timeless-interacting protein [Plakobranchus ocellatus]|uniref:TIMELESS-interacting protein n=1 Tax=Plakobranchus ocellatus TaxID=259542 RepID=A0AAV4BV80_9GAST|nr:timeless-interacting protein [Plakobranchus ocellatus]
MDLDMDDIFGAYEGEDDEGFNPSRLPDLEDELQPMNDMRRDKVNQGGEERDFTDNAELLAKLKSMKGASKHTTKRSLPKLDAARLTGERGIAVLPKVFEHVYLKGRNNEAEDLKVIMHTLQHWGHRLFPKMPFDEVLERVERLGARKEVKISSDGRNNSEVASRIAQAKTNFQKMKTVLTNKNISIRTRRRALECYIEPILMYGCEAWTISKQTQKKLEATEMWFIRRMLRISWTAKKTNDTVLEEAHTTRLLISKIRKRQATFFGHVMRREKLENLVTTGMLEGKRSRGKQREKLIEGLTDWLKAGKSLEAIEAIKDRKKWRTMIANAVKQGT